MSILYLNIESPADRLEAARIAKQLTKRGLAEMLRVPPTHLSEISACRAPVGEKLARSLQDLFGVSEHWLLRGIGAPFAKGAQPDQAFRQSLEDYAERTASPGAEGFATLPVFAEPLEEPPLERLHLSTGRRPVARDRWRATRYYLAVPDAKMADGPWRKGDFLLVESEPARWGGLAKGVLLTLKLGGKAAVREGHASLRGDGIVEFHPTRKRRGAARNAQDAEPEVCGLLGVVVAVERDFRVPR